MSAKGILKDYVTVRERVMAAQEQIQEVVVTRLEMVGDNRGIITVRVTLKDGRIGEGSEAFQFGLTGKSAQATSPVPDAETSALGRALQWLGFYADRPSMEEIVRAKAAAAAEDDRQVLVAQLLDLMGTVESSGHELTPVEIKLLNAVNELPIERLEKGLRHFENVLAHLPPAAS
jgi:hypothetical protein